MATTAPDDLKAFRTSAMSECGFTDPVEIGIVGDQAHEERGGYHISGDGIHAKGNFNSDFSTKRPRDHFLPNPFASAVDIGDNWPRGGRSAWLRFNNNTLWEIMNTNQMPSIRAINCSTDGSNKKRYDRANAGSGLINSGDTVTIHTHFEFWRDTNNHRDADLERLNAHIKAARDNISIWEALGGAPEALDTIGENDVIFQVTSVPPGTKDMAGITVPENGQCMATPAGPFALSGTEFFSLPVSAQPIRITMTWARLSKMCWGLSQVDPTPIVNAVVAAVNALEVTLTPEDIAAIAAATASAVKDQFGPAFDTRMQEALVNGLKSQAGQEALRTGANLAEDS